MKRLPLFLAIAALAGCTTVNREENTATQRVEERVGIEAGQPTQLTITTREQSAAQSQAQAGIDLTKAIQATIAGFKGDLLGAINAAKPAPIDLQPLIAALPKQTGGIDGATGGALGVAGSLGLIALREFMARKQAQQDAEAEWKRANESHTREVELAKQLPPTSPA